MKPNYKDGELMMEGVKLSTVASVIGTPVYCYSRGSIEAAYRGYENAFVPLANTLICYAVKANTNQAVIGTLAALGAGADVVSEGELRRALKAGVQASKIVYSGVAKKHGEMEFALKAGIYQFNVESEPELLALSKVADRLGLTASIALRVNPDVDAKTHDKIATGKSENKFGIPWRRVRAVYRLAGSLPGIRVQGIAMHIGSQLLSLEPYRAAYGRLAEMIDALVSDGVQLDSIDIGGGLGIRYEDDQPVPPEPAELAAMAHECLGHFGGRLIIEPGRSLLGAAGVLLSEVIYVKSGESRDFIIVDAAMNDLIRPAMYDAYHGVTPLQAPSGPARNYDIVGPVCESGDTFAKARAMSEVKAGDRVAFMDTGAYGAVMAGTYNSRLLVPEVMIAGAHFGIIRPRGTYEDLIGLDSSWDEVPSVKEVREA
ncbi:diaminopimelate decarboxylase [Kordiimonas aestuarii]|uniref:diaminopimelate decarboxylase n=1 Tax=Kordiimonas aestuarii TaxID=1005925 RepID=UPI0021D12BF0|nr:diaminopimelate decarboxylase [Kordiimonas aestuarii]